MYQRSWLLASLQRQALGELGLREDDRLLDVACGYGKLVRAAAPQVERAAGVDLSPGMIAGALRRAEDDPPEVRARIGFKAGSSDELPFDDREFTAVVTTTAFHHFPEPAASVREMVRVLAPGGRIVIGDLSRDTPPLWLADGVLRRVEEGHVGMQRKKDIERLLRDVGIRVTRSRWLWFGAYSLVAGEK